MPYDDNLQRGVDFSPEAAEAAAESSSPTSRPRAPADLRAPVRTEDPSYLKSFLAGVDPRGTYTMELGRRTKPKHYTGMQLAGVIGGLLGGGAVVPGVLGGIARVVPALLAGKRGGRELGRIAWGGATDIYKQVWRALKSGRALSSAAKERRALTAAERQGMLKAIERNVTVGDFTKSFAKLQKSDPAIATAMQQAVAHGKTAPEVIVPAWRTLQMARGTPEYVSIYNTLKAGGKISVQDANKLLSRAVKDSKDPTVKTFFKALKAQPGSVGAVESVVKAIDKNEAQIGELWRVIQAGEPITPELAAPLLSKLNLGALTGGLAIGGAGGVTGYSAYKQYGLGQEQRAEEQKARQRALDAYYRGLRASKYSSERMGIIKQAIEQYNPTPFSGLTAISDFEANRRYAPKPPKKPNSDAQAGLEAARAALPPANKRNVSKVEAARKTALA